MADKLTIDRLKGIWAGVTLPWDERYGLDEATFRENLRRLVAAGVHGIYTTGSTGEFYSLDPDEFRAVVDIFTDEVGPTDIPTQVGCHDVVTHRVLGMVAYARQAGAGAAQLALPFWMKLAIEDVVRFWADVSEAAPGFPLTSYNISRTDWYLYEEEYERILQVAPGLIGIKWGGSPELDIARLEGAVAALPGLAHFVGEPRLLKAMKFGVRGCYSAWALVNPPLAVKMFEHAQAGQWDAAHAIHSRFTAFTDLMFDACKEFGLVVIDPTFDKACGVISGFLAGNQRTRPPYTGWSDDAVAIMKRRARDRFPDIMFA